MTAGFLTAARSVNGRLKSGLRAINPYWTESPPAVSQTNFSYTSKKISFCVL